MAAAKALRAAPNWTAAAPSAAAFRRAVRGRRRADQVQAVGRLGRRGEAAAGESPRPPGCRDHALPRLGHRLLDGGRFQIARVATQGLIHQPVGIIQVARGQGLAGKLPPWCGRPIESDPAIRPSSPS